MMIRRRDAALGIALMGLWSAKAATAQTEAPVIAAASDLSFALQDIADRFTAQTGLQIRLAFGSTGNFARQIREGAPFQMFMAADEQFIRDLHRDGHTRDDGALYGIGRIAMIVPNGSALVADGTLDTLRAALAAGQITRFAIANPDHAPYGRCAEQALRHAGLWDALQPHLVLGENVAQAAQFALSGNAEGGIIAYALALAPQVAAQGSHALIPDAWHEPLRQRMVLLNGAGPEAEAFYAHIQTAPARDIMARYGFALQQG